MSEWLRSVTRNHMGSARTGSSPVAVVFYPWMTGELFSEFINASSNLFELEGNSEANSILAPRELAISKVVRPCNLTCLSLTLLFCR